MKTTNVIIVIALLIIATACQDQAGDKDGKTTDKQETSESFDTVRLDNGTEYYVPVTSITEEPGFHWFGYYDKYQTDPTSRYVLSNKVDFEGRSPKEDDKIEVGMVDLQDGNKWTKLGETYTWNWQQGCMLQWLPGSDDEVIWNARKGDKFISVIKNVKTGEEREIPYPIYTIGPDGKTALTLDFERVNHMRPGYGYEGLPDRNKDVLAPEDMGIYKVNLETGEGELILSLADIAKVPFPDPEQDLSKAKHYFNVIIFNPSGTRFLVLHRWRYEGKRGWTTRVLTADVNGENIHIIDDNGFTSHLIWRDDSTILAESRTEAHGQGLYLIKDTDEDVEPEWVDIGRDPYYQGHCTYLPGLEWIVTDSYPKPDGRLQEVVLFNTKTKEKIKLGEFHSPEAYNGEWRVDLHPRHSRDGKFLIIDSPFRENGRQLHTIDISSIVEK